MNSDGDTGFVCILQNYRSTIMFKPFKLHTIILPMLKAEAIASSLLLKMKTETTISYNKNPHTYVQDLD